jgi:crotonobetainyl-CoA:carnitine CoA-transferase CaiB-like acyl-CoA transferase
MPGILEGIRVLDLTHVLAGPFAGYQLAVMGAEVIKIESPLEPDQARFQGSDAQLSEAGMGTAFLAQGSNKKCLSLNLKTDAGRQVLHRLVKTADILIENYRPGALDALGLGYEALAATHPGLIYCSISAFGSTGPKRELTAYDGVIQAYSGMMAMTGEPDTAPVKCGAPVVDYATGTTAAAAILGALFHRVRAGGRGQFVDVAMSEVALVLSSSHVTGYLWNGAHPEQKGNSYPFATIGCYQASDMPLMISASNLRQQKRLWEVLERPDLVKESNAQRIRDFANEAKALAEIIATRSAGDWEEALRRARVPVSRVQRLEAMLSDPQTRDRAVLHAFSEESGALDGLAVPVAAFRMSSTDVAVTTAPRQVGADNEAILRALGYTAQDIATLRDSAAV